MVLAVDMLALVLVGPDLSLVSDVAVGEACHGGWGAASWCSISSSARCTYILKTQCNVYVSPFFHLFFSWADWRLSHYAISDGVLSVVALFGLAVDMVCLGLCLGLVLVMSTPVSWVLWNSSSAATGWAITVLSKLSFAFLHECVMLYQTVWKYYRVMSMW